MVFHMDDGADKEEERNGELPATVIKRSSEKRRRSNEREKYKELKIESNRGKVTDSYYMGHESRSRQRFQSQQRVRRDSQGRDYIQDRKGRNDSRG